MRKENELKIVVLMGGTSAERDVSLASGEAIVEALRSKDHNVIPIDSALGKKFLSHNAEFLPEGIGTEPPDIKALEKKGGELTLKTLESFELNDVDVVFLALHGGSGEDGTIQALLDLAGKPYTGSGMLASALAMDKAMSKKIFEQSGILTPKWFLVETKDSTDISTIENKAEKFLGFPLVIKPNNQGSTVGFSLIENKDDLKEGIKKAKMFSDKILFEEYIPGRELTVGILDNQALPVIEIVPEHGIYDYECKYTKGKSRYICPADLPKEKTKEIRAIGLRAFQALGCKDYARVDFRYSPDEKLYCLEVNTLPGMTSTSLVPKAAKGMGIDFPELVERITKLAWRKKKR
jgi:D-alanine-D-alanine ligase